MNEQENKLYEILDRKFGRLWSEHSAVSDFKSTGELLKNIKSHWTNLIHSLGIIIATCDVDDRIAELNARRIGDFCIPDPASRRQMGKSNMWLVVPKDLAMKILVLGELSC